jgi:hypothetical protein
MIKMSQFTTPFVGELVGRNLWKVVTPFEYHVGRYPSEEVIVVPVGFVTNLQVCQDSFGQ